MIKKLCGLSWMTANITRTRLRANSRLEVTVDAVPELEQFPTDCRVPSSDRPTVMRVYFKGSSAVHTLYIDCKSDEEIIKYKSTMFEIKKHTSYLKEG